MQRDSPVTPTSPPIRYDTLVWSLVDAGLLKSALFYAERYFVEDVQNHDARHLYATVLIESGQPHTAHRLVNALATRKENRCIGCLNILAKACLQLGRHGQAREAFEACLQEMQVRESLGASPYTPTPSMGPRTASAFPDAATLYCQAGNSALKGNLHDAAAANYREALRLNKWLWEAFEGLCALGKIPPIDELFPPRPEPVLQKPGHIPVATGAGFFTPDAGNAGNVFNDWKPGFKPMEARAGPRDSIVTTDSSFYAEPSFHAPIRASRSQPANLAVQPPAVRPLSSADEAGPVTKKLRSTARQRPASTSTTAAEPHPLKPSKSAGAVPAAADDRPRGSKARARPALTNANLFSSSGRSAQNTAASSRLQALGVGKLGAGAGARRSTRLGSKPVVKVRPLSVSTLLCCVARGCVADPAKRQAATRRRVTAKTRSKSQLHDSGVEEEPGGATSALAPGSPGGLSAHSESPPPPSAAWTAEQERLAEEAYAAERTEYEMYNLMRKFASAARALALYDCRLCLGELADLPPHQQRSAFVMSMLGRAHYELGQYPAAERAFEAVRVLEPYRLWDMEVYSTLLWHLQRNIRLSFLAQELLSTNPKSPQAWIAVGNTFSLQKEKTQALTCFRRAAQLDPTCAYAYTLSGHESIDEDVNKAISFFQSALRADARHYNAWYGLGTCYMRMSKLRLADYHFRKASAIHPQNAVLLGCVGMVRERYMKYDEALELFDRAIEYSPENALVRYHRAKILIALKRYTAALADLQDLRDKSPEESNVLFQLAKVHRLMGNQVAFTQLLAEVRDVAPKSLGKIRKLAESIRAQDVGEEVMDEG
ncbi:protein prenylyltransferase [Lenzites betulinus]|nr:protein prenylyltransferase [Lenzites betulinus]